MNISIYLKFSNLSQLLAVRAATPHTHWSKIKNAAHVFWQIDGRHKLHNDISEYIHPKTAKFQMLGGPITKYQKMGTLKSLSEKKIRITTQ